MKRIFFQVALTAFVVLSLSTLCTATTMEEAYKSLKKIQIMCETGTNINSYQDAVASARIEVESLQNGNPDTIAKLQDILNDYVYASKAWINSLSRYDKEILSIGFGGHEEQYIYFSKHAAAQQSTSDGPGRIKKINMDKFLHVAWQIASDKLNSITPESLLPRQSKKKGK